MLHVRAPTNSEKKEKKEREREKDLTDRKRRNEKKERKKEREISVVGIHLAVNWRVRFSSIACCMWIKISCG